MADLLPEVRIYKRKHESKKKRKKVFLFFSVAFLVESVFSFFFFLFFLIAFLAESVFSCFLLWIPTSV